jgi:hypothetical protein
METHKNDEKAEVQDAEHAVETNLSKFESAMNHLADKIEGTNTNVRQAIEILAVTSSIVGVYFVGRYLVRKFSHSPI